MNLLNRYTNRNKWLMRELEWSDCSCSDSVIQMNHLERVSSELNSQVWTGRTCERMRVRNWYGKKQVTNVEF